MSIGTPSSPAATKPANGAAPYRVPLWGAAVAMAVTAAFVAWWAPGPDEAAPAAVVQPGPSAAAQDPRERCGRRHLIALHRCLVRECEKPEVQAHRDCHRLREVETRARDAFGG